MSKKQNKSVGVRLTEPVYKALVDKSNSDDVAMSQVVQRALVNHLGLSEDDIPKARKRRSDQKPITSPGGLCNE